MGKDIVKILGRWRSDAVDVYLWTSTWTLTEGYSELMVQAGGYKFAPDQVESTLPHLVPENASDDVQDEYISQLLEYNDDVDKFDETVDPVTSS